MSSEQEFKCIFCSDTFSLKEDLQIHFRKHGDPSFHLVKKHKGRSQDETEELVEKPKDQVEVVQCDVCPEVFLTISKAITHKHRVHPDQITKYFCHWCGKLFTMKHLYNKHMQVSHSEMEQGNEIIYHCDSCDVDFNLPSAMVYHNKFYHRQDELPSLGHSKKLKVILEEVIQINYCPFCGEEYINKVNLHKHMTDDHSYENQRPEDLFRCPLCDAIFYYLDAYELHLTYHSIEDLYTERSEKLDEITDFSLETVQPLQEKVETADPVNEELHGIGIEELLEFTMDDATDNRKAKKHKKHKKSKKAAITLDEFLNMNKDVFGEGIDFQGIEEVPTQAVAKRLKTKKTAPASKVMSSDLAKLKRQGITVKKQPTKTGKPIKINKADSKSATKISKLTSTDDVLSKLLNQGSQIKIVKKSNQNSEDNIHQEDAVDEERLSPKNMEAKNDEDGSKTAEVNTEDERENVVAKNLKISTPKQMPAIQNPESPSVIGDNAELEALQNFKDDRNATLNDEIDDSPDQSVNIKNCTDKLKTLRNNSNIDIKLSKKIVSDDKNDTESEDVSTAHVKERDGQESAKQDASVSENSSLNALKHLSHLITVKPVNTTQILPLSVENKHENGLEKVETDKTSNILQNTSSKTSEAMNLTNLKNLGSITIKPTTQSNLNPTKKQQSVEARNDQEDHETDDELNSSEEKSIGDKSNADKLAHMLKSPQLSIQAKKSPMVVQKESPKANNDNSQSSTDLLKHLKNVTAKPVNVNSQNVPTPKTSPSSVKGCTIAKTFVHNEVTDDGIEIFNIDDSDSDDTNYNNMTNSTTIKTEFKMEVNKSTDDINEKDTLVNSPNAKFSSPKPNQKHVAINNVLRNLSKNITVKSRNSSPSQGIHSQDHNSRDSNIETNEADSDSDSPLSRVKITDMENMSDDEFSEEHVENAHGNVEVQHSDNSKSDYDDGPVVEEYDDLSDIESHVAAAMVQKNNSISNSNSIKNFNKDLTIKSLNNKKPVNSKADDSLQSEEIPQFAKSLSNQISIKQIKKPEENKNIKVVEQTGARSMNQSSINHKMASSSNQVNTFNKEVKTVKTFQTDTKTVIQEITTTVTKTIKTVNQTTKQEVRSMAQSSSAPMVAQKVQGMSTKFSPKNFQGMKVRQSMPNVRPKIRGQPPQTVRPAISGQLQGTRLAPPQNTRPAICAAPQITRPAICGAPQSIRPAICAPPQAQRPAICGPVRASNQLVPVRPTLNRFSGPRPRMPNVMNMRATTSGLKRPQMGRHVKVAPGAVFSPSPRTAEGAGHFSCFKKPKESLIPVPDFSAMNKNDGESSVQFSSATHMSKSNFSSTTKTVKGNSVVTSTQVKSEMSASSQQLSKLRNMSGLSVVKTSQSQAKQTQVEEKSEMSTSKRNALEAIQKLQNQGLLVKKPRLDVSEDSDHSLPGSDDMGHDSNEEFDE